MLYLCLLDLLCQEDTTITNGTTTSSGTISTITTQAGVTVKVGVKATVKGTEDTEDMAVTHLVWKTMGKNSRRQRLALRCFIVNKLGYYSTPFNSTFQRRLYSFELP